MLTRSIRQSIGLVVLCAVACAATVTPASSQRTMVSREQIADAMQSAGFDTSASQLQLLSNVTSLLGATLRVAKVTRESADTALAELNCQKRRCLPFYVLVHDADFASSTAITPVHTSGCNPAETHPLIGRGKSVTLIITTADLRIVLPAISLEGGKQGQVIRVTSPDRKRTYRAEVVNSTTVRSTL
jgi:Chaperone for flagella basal body P-ring formation